MALRTESSDLVADRDAASGACDLAAVQRKLGAAGFLNSSDLQVLDDLLSNRFSSPAGSLLVSEKQPDSDARVLLLTGEPLREPVVGQGPFVMNTREQIQQAIQDYQSGRMGQLA